MAKASGKAGSVFYSPHIHGRFSIENIMWDVVIALLPALAASIYFFGFNSVRILAISLVTSLVTELAMGLITRRGFTLLNGSAVITAILFAFNMPPSVPWYIVATGSFFAIAIVKWAFGGLGCNFMNPALAGRVFVLAAWPAFMTGRWSPTIPQTLADTSAVGTNIIHSAMTNAAGVKLTGITNTITNFITNDLSFQGLSSRIISVDAVSAATPLTALKAGGWDASITQSFNNFWNLFSGNHPGCIGETSALALLIGFIYLVVKGVVKPFIPLVYVGTTALLAWIFGALPQGGGLFAGNVLYHILGGGLILGACFMATDFVTSPITLKGSLIYAACLGILTVIIRLWGGYPEGVSYAILIMNIFVPIIDRLTRSRIYGHNIPKERL